MLECGLSLFCREFALPHSGASEVHQQERDWRNSQHKPLQNGADGYDRGIRRNRDHIIAASKEQHKKK